MKLNELDLAEARRLYASGDTLAGVGRRFGVTAQAIWFAFKRDGVERRSSPAAHRKAMRDDSFDVLDEEALYWAGFLMADGYLSDPEGNATPQIELALAITDRVHVETFKTFLAAAHPLTVHKSCGYGGSPTVRLSFRSERVAQRLLELWSGGRKSLARVPVAEVAESRHFWRGAVDGDGSIQVACDVYARISFVGSIVQVERYREFLFTNGIPRNSIRRRGTIFELRHGGNSALGIARLLYDDAKVALPRKKVAAGLFSDIRYRNKTHRRRSQDAA